MNELDIFLCCLHVNDGKYLLSPCFPVICLNVVYADIFGEDFVGDGKRIKPLRIVGPAGRPSFDEVRRLRQSNEVMSFIYVPYVPNPP